MYCERCDKLGFNKCLCIKPQTSKERLTEIETTIASLRPTLDEAIDQGEPYTGGLHYVMGKLLAEKAQLEAHIKGSVNDDNE